jgi:hypothetical protein
LKQTIWRKHIDADWLQNHPDFDSETYIQVNPDTNQVLPRSADEAEDHLEDDQAWNQNNDEDYQQYDVEDGHINNTPAFELPWQFEATVDEDMYTEAPY